MPPTHSSPPPHTREAPAARPALATAAKLASCAGLVALVFTIGAIRFTGRLDMRALHAPANADPLWIHATLYSFEILLGVLLAAFLLQPLAARLMGLAGGRWRRTHTALAVLGICAFLCVFLIHFGRHQFGGWDFNIMLEEGWRQSLGQRQYIELLSPTPPGFNLGIRYAFEVFGLSWDANLYLSAIFACATFLWMYWLLRKLEVGALAAMGTAFAIECVTMLLLSFWWYNNSALIMAAVFLLACLVYARRPPSIAVQASYFAALVLLALMKPNVAGTALPGGVLLLLIATRSRWRLLWLTLGGVTAVLLIFAANHISLSAMLASYREISKLRGGFSAFGYRQIGHIQDTEADCALFAFALPWLWLLRDTLRRARAKDWSGVAVLLFLPLALLVSIYALRTNGDAWILECAPLIAVSGVVVYGMKLGSRPVAPPALRRFYTAMLCAAIAFSLYMGAARLRVYTIGPHQFFEWTDNENTIDSGPLKHMRVSRTMIEVQQQIRAAVASNPGPVFFGPRLNFDYMVLGLDAPTYLPTFWQPGVAFGMDQEPQLVQVWKDHRFPTLIFLNGDYTFYPPELMNAIARDYTRDDRYPAITVYHRRAAGQ